jgi:hypothetical protein
MESRERVDTARIALRTLPTALLTAKIGIGKKHDIAFSPYTHVFSRVEIGGLAGVNVDLAKALVDQIRERGGAEIGSIHRRGLLSRGWSATEVADVLDAWALSNHNPDPADYPHAAFHRAVDASRPVRRTNDPRNDPYLVAAYLRWWSANPNPVRAPQFNVGVTYGPLRNNTVPFSFALLNRAVTTTGQLNGGWGGDDKIIDSPRQDEIDDAGDRKVGADGLLLLHIVHAAATGRSVGGHMGGGHARALHTISFGIAIPAGGQPFSVVVNYDRG